MTREEIESSCCVSNSFASPSLHASLIPRRHPLSGPHIYRHRARFLCSVSECEKAWKPSVSVTRERRADSCSQILAKRVP